MSPSTRQLLSVLAALLVVITTVGAVPAAAEPDETGTPTLMKLRANLSAAAEGYIKAESDLAVSQGKKAKLELQLSSAELDIISVRHRVAKYAAEAYRTGRVSAMSMLLQATSTEDFLGRAQALDKVARADLGRIDELKHAQTIAAVAKIGIDEQMAVQAAALEEMNKRKAAAEQALKSAQATRSEVDSSGLPVALAAPRNSDGSWPNESCSLDDPTTSGCITPRTQHSLDEAKRAGFGWYVSCFRPGDQWEHPKGRACDFAAFPSGFVNSSATGDHKVYGDRLAAFFVKNAKALGVMYVVWYCQIWQVSSGWHRYNSAGSTCGDAPAGDHTNHVHLSVY